MWSSGGPGLIGLQKSRTFFIVLSSSNLVGTSVASTTRILVMSGVGDTGLGVVRQGACRRARTSLYAAQTRSGTTTESARMLMDVKSTAGGAVDGLTAARRAALVVVAPGVLEAEWVSKRA